MGSHWVCCIRLGKVVEALGSSSSIYAKSTGLSVSFGFYCIILKKAICYHLHRLVYNLSIFLLNDSFD
ncbi:hypothetical protein H5410_033428, partial [Solanum commersonii]